MAVYDANGNELQNIYDMQGDAISKAYDANGTQVFQGGDVLTTYDMFYPNDATSDYEYTYPTYCTLTSEQFLALNYDDFVSNPPTGITVTKTSLGKDAGLYDIYEYNFCPANPKRKILLISGVHTTELAAQFGLALLIKHIYRTDDNTAFAYIRNNVNIKVVPVFNAYGYNQNPRTYWGYGGINPERNFAYGDLWNIYNGTSQQDVKGDYPFQSDVSRIMARWYVDNQDADFSLNCHTGSNYANYDLWVDYMDNDPIVPALTSAVQKNVDEFELKFGSTARVRRSITSYPNNTGMGMHGMWNQRCAKIAGFWVEQAEKNTIFGNGNVNSAGAINNYASVLSTYVMEFLLNKYQSVYDAMRPSNKKPIVSATANNVSLGSSDVYANVALTLSPTDTTQFTFDWTSSDTSVCEVWSATNEAVIVKRGTGTAIVTATNKSNPNVSVSFTVTAT